MGSLCTQKMLATAPQIARRARIYTVLATAVAKTLAATAERAALSALASTCATFASFSVTGTFASFSATTTFALDSRRRGVGVKRTHRSHLFQQQDCEQAKRKDEKEKLKR